MLLQLFQGLLAVDEVLSHREVTITSLASADVSVSGSLFDDFARIDEASLTAMRHIVEVSVASMRVQVWAAYLLRFKHVFG